jgi:protein-L-isoaspartate(D-aspartate) O-methyltransferase
MGAMQRHGAAASRSGLSRQHADYIHVRHMVVAGESVSMVDFERARQVMVDSQIRPAGVTDGRILAQFLSVAREVFVPPSRHDLAYSDDIHWFGRPGASRFMPAPATFARLLQLAGIGEDDAVLDVGAATGYSTAIIAGLAASVVGLEADPQLAAAAAANLRTLGLDNAGAVAGGIAGLADGQFDVILAQGMLDTMPAALVAALNEGGRLVALLRHGPVGIASVFTKAGGKVAARAEFNAQLPPLYGVQREVEFVF